MIELIGSNEIIAVILAVVGGLGSFLQGCRGGELKRTLFNLITELVLAIITGLFILYLGMWRSWEPALTNTLILVLTNNGGDTLAKAKALLVKVLKKRYNLGDNENG